MKATSTEIMRRLLKINLTLKRENSKLNFDELFNLLQRRCVN